MEKLTELIATIKLLICDCNNLQERLYELRGYEKNYILQAVKGIIQFNQSTMYRELNEISQRLTVSTNSYESNVIKRTENIAKLASETEVGIHKVEAKILQQLDKIIANHAKFVDSLTAFFNRAQKLLTDLEMEHRATNTGRRKKEVNKIERKLNCWKKKARKANNSTIKKHNKFLKLVDDEIDHFSQKHKKGCRKVVKRFRATIVRTNIIAEMIR